MNKIKIFEEQDRVKVEFDFESIDVARLYFNDEECIKDLVEAFGCEEDGEESEEVTNSEIEEMMSSLRKTISTAPTCILNGLQKMIDNEIGKRE